jgi:hypothetical protein
MLKRNIGILIAGALLSTQVNLAAADQGTFPPSADDMVWKPLSAQAKYLDERAPRPQVATARVNTFPQTENDIIWAMLPAQAKYFERREATLQARKLEVSAPGGE